MKHVSALFLLIMSTVLLFAACASPVSNTPTGTADVTAGSEQLLLKVTTIS